MTVLGGRWHVWSVAKQRYSLAAYRIEVEHRQAVIYMTIARSRRRGYAGPAGLSFFA